MMRSRSRPVLARALVVAGLLGTSLGAGSTPASAQWFGMLDAGPIPPGAIVRSLMRRGFLEIGRPRFTGETYVVEGVNARGQRLRLVIDAFDGDVIARTRLDAPLLPPADVGRERTARADPFRRELGPGPDDGFAAPGFGRDPGRDRIDRGELPPPGGRRADRIEPPLTEPGRTAAPNAVNPAARPAEPRRGERAQPQQRQARKPEPSARQPALPPPGKADPAGPSVPPAPSPAVEAAKPVPQDSPPPAAAAPLPAPPAAAPAPAKPAEAREPVPAQRTVRVIEGVTPVVPQAGDAPKPPADEKSEITPPATLE
ncbi:MAG TPA: hypothetical protein VF601_19745 [Beijerinckiaceae bacterium]|jgi:hypothetical protein